MSFADAVAREVEWLSDPQDGLPALLVAQEGPFDLIVPYGRTRANSPDILTNPKVLAVARESAMDVRFDYQQRLFAHQFRLTVQWPLTSPGTPEACFADVDAALDDLVAKIRGPWPDHTHGGRFMAVAEGMDTGATTQIDVVWSDYDTARVDNQITVTVRYVAVDAPFTA